ncbi:unnamed protein product [Arabis nemorensis]|uniref:Ubiquitin-like protease family profile domain-containing protein n=1 Tax=Arabis nemorensis TaxID=586526 RepID=A0A565BM80_9BRAS|nr:unnamed protein product [Arabis nemorensis]
MDENSRDMAVDLGMGDGDADKKFFVELMTPQKWLDDKHINAGMSLLRRRLSKVPCPFRNKNFSENPEEFAWSAYRLLMTKTCLNLSNHMPKALTFPLDEGATVAQYNIKKCNKVPHNLQSGDCGIYALKYIECLALDFDMQVGLCDSNMKSIRKKLAAEVFAGADHSGGL